jgi:hypothetical protein
MARPIRQRLGPLHVEVGHGRTVLHVRRVAPLVEVAQVTDIDDNVPLAGDAAADLPISSEMGSALQVTRSLL